MPLRELHVCRPHLHVAHLGRHTMRYSHTVGKSFWPFSILVCLLLLSSCRGKAPPTTSPPETPSAPTSPQEPGANVPLEPAIPAPIASEPHTTVPIDTDCVPCKPGNFSGSNCTGCPPGSCSSAQLCTPCATGHAAPDNGTVKCGVCDQGHFSPSPGHAHCLDCPVRFFCPRAANGVTDPLPCPMGSYCPQPNLTYPINCPPGFFCASIALSSPQRCPAGSYCPDFGTLKPIPCPPNHYCLEGSISAFSCPALYKSNQSASGCKPAPSFFVLIVGAILLVIAIGFGIYIYRSRWMIERDVERIPTRRTRPKHERMPLIEERTQDDRYQGI